MDDTLYCWGVLESEEGRLIPPTGKWKMVSVTGAYDAHRVEGTFALDHGCAINFDGKLECWGANESGQLDVPELETPWETVSTGIRRTCGLNQGDLYCWGASMRNP